MAGNYFDFGFRQRQALANQLGGMALRAWLQAQAMRAAQEREKALENYRQLMLALEGQRVGESQRYHKAKEKADRERERRLEKSEQANLRLQLERLSEQQRHDKAEEEARRQELNRVLSPGVLMKTKDGRIGYLDQSGFHEVNLPGVEPLVKHSAASRPLSPGDIVRTKDGRIGFITRDGHFQEIRIPITERPFAPSSLNPELEKLLSPATPIATATPVGSMTPRPTPSATPIAPRSMPSPTPSESMTPRPIASPTPSPALPSTSTSIAKLLSGLPSTSIVPTGGAPRTVNVHGLGAGMRVDTTPDGRPVYLFTSGKRLALRRETLRELNANP